MKQPTLAKLEQAAAWRRNNRLHTIFPETGLLSRHNYPAHMQFLAAGATHMERLCIAGNRTGKSEMATWEVAIHATGLYPSWWQGRRFNHPVDIWVAGETGETTRDILQAKLLGQTERAPGSTEKIGMGTGMIPADLIVSTAPKAGIPNAVDMVWIKHVSGRNSSIGFKSYGKDQNTATSWMGTHKSIILLDEEPDFITYGEALMRLMSTVPGEESGMMIITFTPLKGYTEVVKKFLETDDPGCYHQFISWDQCPHITEKIRNEMARKYLPSQLKARSQGIPAMGEGAIYPVDIDDITVEPFPIPSYWPRCFGMDVGKTAVVWLAKNPDTDTVYAHDEYFSTEYNPVIHTDAIKRRGPIPGVIDPSSLQSNQMDGQKLFDIYKNKGLDVAWEKTGVESGIQEVWERISSGTFKVFSTLGRFRQEYQRYHRVVSETRTGQISKIVKKDDHLMDACLSGDTEVITSNGSVAVSSLVGTTGKVLSRCGSWANYNSCRLTRPNASVVRLQFSFGPDIVCTPDHEFLTSDGWVKALNMQGRSCYNGISQSIGVSNCKSTLFHRPFRSFKGFATICADSISSVVRTWERSASIASSGPQLMTSTGYPMDSMSITKTTTERTTSPTTSNCWRTPSTVSTTCLSERLHLPQQRLSPLRQNGMDRTPEENGTGGIMLSMDRPCMLVSPEYVSSAEIDSRDLLETIDSAPTNANLRGVVHLGWMMRNVLAWFAAWTLWLINTAILKPAPDDAVDHCVKVSAAGNRDVYCLSVPGSQSFCVAAGQVVHNCRYGIVSGLKRAKPMTWLNRDRAAQAQQKVMQAGGQGNFFSGGNGAWMG